MLQIRKYALVKKIKSFLSVLLCIAGVLWLIPTVFVETTQLEITDYTLTKEGDIEDSYEISFTYPRGDEKRTGKYTENYPKGWEPSVGGQGVCHYYTVPPFSVRVGDAASPVPPLCCIALGLLLVLLKKPKFLSKKKENPDE